MPHTNELKLGYLRMLADERTTSFYVEGGLYGCVIFFRAFSEDYDRYLKSSISKMLVYESINDPSQWLDESEVYSNIENGLGIFGAYADRRYVYGLRDEKVN